MRRVIIGTSIGTTVQVQLQLQVQVQAQPFCFLRRFSEGLYPTQPQNCFLSKTESAIR